MIFLKVNTLDIFVLAVMFVGFSLEFERVFFWGCEELAKYFFLWSRHMVKQSPFKLVLWSLRKTSWTVHWSAKLQLTRNRSTIEFRGLNERCSRKILRITTVLAFSLWRYLFDLNVFPGTNQIAWESNISECFRKTYKENTV